MGDNLNASFNYRYGKLSIYNYTYYGHFRNFNKYDISTHYKEKDTFIDMKTDGKGWSTSFSDRLSLTYELNDKHSIGGNFRVGVKDGSPVNNTQSMIKNGREEQIDMSGSVITEKLRIKEYQAAINYDWRIDEKGSMFKFIADYLRYNNNKKQDNNYQYNLLDQEQAYEEITSNRVDDQTDMVEIDARLEKKVNDKWQLDIGLNYNLTHSEQLLDFQNLENDMWAYNPELSDNYKLTGENYAGYVNVTSTLGKYIFYKVGVRVQENRIAYNSLKINHKNDKHYRGIYPSVNLMYSINREKGTSLGFSYQKSIGQIPYNAINPVVQYANEYFYTRGNVEIKPTTYHVLGIQGTLNNRWNFAYIFGYVKDNLFFKTYQDEKDPLITYTMPVNEGKNYMHGLMVDRTFKLTEWWNLKGTGRIQRLKYEGNYLNTNSWKSYISIYNNITFKNGWGGSSSDM